MTKHMLIDAAHPEEVRVCVLENGRVDDFDFEFSSRRPLRGNIYLARVTRVEPSLQAAFVEFGGNRHGFLAFNEIHPDYYQIPVSDRRLLQEAEAEEAALAAALGLDSHEDENDLDGDEHAGGDEEAADFRDNEPVRADDEDEDDAEETAVEDEEAVDPVDENRASVDAAAFDAAPGPFESAPYEVQEKDSGAIADGEPAADGDADATSERESDDDARDDEGDADESGDDSTSGEDGAEQEPSPRRSAPSKNRAELLERYKEARRKRQRLLRNYKIQEVIKRRQIMLVQVVKEERGTKGAALTTYMSLAGRYCVLMPNTARGGGISRKIGVAADRKRLRRVVDELAVPEGMGLIIRTAGAKRTKTEVKRDYDYLTRLWENIRTLTLQSIAPCLIYEEASLIKRAIRDLYDKDIDSVTVEGDDGYREAKDFMKMLMPSHAKNVRQHKDGPPLFLAHDVESQLDAMYQPVVRLKSGGYIVIHQTEALVAIDVNSGKATRERNIEQTALKTNLEAAKEAARQCRLRDLAGLIVIDFIDMDEQRNNRAVEKKFKDALKDDRARIQVGRISNFGLLEMSRQRRRSGIVDGTTHVCPTCNGAGNVRSHEMAALRILRAIETSALKERAATITVKASVEVTLYILNHKRAWLKRIEDTYAVTVEIVADGAKAGDQFDLERRGAPRELPHRPQVVRADQTEAIEIDLPQADESDEDAERLSEDLDGGRPRNEAGAEGEGGRRRRRRRRRGRRPEDGQDNRNGDVDRHESSPSLGDGHEDEGDGDGDGSDQAEDAVHSAADSADGRGEGQNGEGRRRRRRGRRGGRRNRPRDGAEAVGATPTTDPRDDERPWPMMDAAPASEQPSFWSPEPEPTPVQPAPIEPARSAPAPEWDPPPEKEDLRPAQEPAAAATSLAEEDRGHAPALTETAKEPRQQRKGWWQKAIGQ